MDELASLKAAVDHICSEINRLQQLLEKMKRAFQECGEFFPRNHAGGVAQNGSAGLGENTQATAKMWRTK